MELSPASMGRWLLGPGPTDERGHLLARWLFLRALGLIFFSAFYSLHFQIDGLIGPEGILPARDFLENVAMSLGPSRYWYAPTLLWLGSGWRAMHLLVWAGLVASTLLFLNLWPRLFTLVSMLAFLSFISAAQDFSNYQSDGMLLAAAFIGLFFAPPGLRPGLGERHPPSRASLFLLLWLWFRIYFESGVAKMASHDPEWRHLTAMDHYYENGPLPSWIGWYAQQLPHAFHAATAFATLAIELTWVWMMFLPRRFRLLCFLVVTPFQIGIILTANYAFLNHLVLSLGILLLDDGYLRRLAQPFGEWRRRTFQRWPLRRWLCPPPEASPVSTTAPAAGESLQDRRRFILPEAWRTVHWPAAKMAFSGFFLGWVFYNTTALLLFMLFPGAPLPVSPIVALEPFRISNQYGLFAVMTTARYEIEFQGSRDGSAWVAYPFRYKPQDPSQPPGLYAPYQPRFDWNLWFASLGTWRANLFVVRTEELLLQNDPSVLSLFAGNPFPGAPPEKVRTVLWQYWFADFKTKHEQGLWWRRELRGLYGPVLWRDPGGKIYVIEWPEMSLLPPSPNP